MKKVLFIATMLLATATACNTNTKTEGGDHDHPEHREQVRDTKDAEPEVAAKMTLGQEQYAALLDAYVATKDAFVASDATRAAAMAAELKSSAEAAGEVFAAVAEAAGSIAASDDIEAQREAFHTLSKAFYPVAKANAGGMTVYQQYCPMAFKNAGASWLSTNEEIRNPYFGDAMLTCGNVQETIVAEK